MFVVREAVESDHACVYATWLNSLKHNSQFAARISNGIYFAQQHAVIERLLKRSRTLVATIEEDPSVILGWCCYEPASDELGIVIPAVIHYVYVKPNFRRSGVASKLLDQVTLAGSMYTHETYPVTSFLKSKTKKMVYNPYAAMSAI